MKIQSALKEIDESDSISYNDFFLELQISEEKYISAVRTAIHRPTLVLKRTYAETRVKTITQEFSMPGVLTLMFSLF